MATTSEHITMNAATKLQDALLVLLRTPNIRRYLDANDPKAVAQAVAALTAAGVSADLFDADRSRPELVHVDRPDLVWDADAKFGGTSFAVYYESPYSFEETVARLITISGQEPESSDKTTFDFVGTFKGKVFTLYDYKNDDAIHIGAHHGTDRVDLDGLADALTLALGTASPTPYRATRVYDGSRGSHGFGGR